MAALAALAVLDEPAASAARLRTPRTGLRGVKIHPTPGTGLPPISRSSSKSQGCSAWNSWKESFDSTWAPTRSATRSKKASPRPTAPAGGDTSSAWATASSKALRSEGSIRWPKVASTTTMTSVPGEFGLELPDGVVELGQARNGAALGRDVRSVHDGVGGGHVGPVNHPAAAICPTLSPGPPRRARHAP